MENTLGGEHSSAILPNTGAIIYRTGSYSRDYAKENFCNKNSDGIKCAALIMADNWQIKDDYPW